MSASGLRAAARRTIRRLLALLRVGRLEREMDEEFRFHVEQETEDLVRQGLAPEEARRRALVLFGGVERHKEAARDVRRPRHLEDLVRDLRHAGRSLRRNPGFAAVAVLTIGLGVGANTAIFSVVNQVLLRPLPVRAPERLVMVWEKNPDKDWTMNVAAPANFLDWREQVTAFEDVAAYEDFAGRVPLTGQGGAESLSAMGVTGNFFEVLGVPAALGRTFRWEETWSGGPRTVVLSHAAWQRLFGGDPRIVGRSIELAGRSIEVVGVLPAGFALPREGIDVFYPTGWSAENRTATWFRRAHWLRVIARLRPGVTPAEANAELEAVAARLEQLHPETNTRMGAGLTPLHRFLVGDTRTPLLVLLGAVGLLLLLACANVANLLLVRAAARRREVAVRGALGASRGRVVRQMAAESALLAGLGGAAGVALGWAGTRALEALQPAGLLRVSDIALDARVLLFTLAVTAAAGLLAGVTPAIWSARTPPGDALREGGRSGGVGGPARRAAGLLVAAEVALAVLLVSGAGLLVRSWWELQRVDPGFDARGVLTLSLDLPGARYGEPHEVVGFYRELIARAEALPGVESAAAVRRVPLAGVSWTSDFSVEGWPPDRWGAEVHHREVTTGYFRTMRVPVIRGRAFTEADDETSPPVVVVNQTLADRFFPGEDPVGQRLAFERAPDSTSTWRTIVGVVGSERQEALAAEPLIEILAPLAQEVTSGMSLVVRTRGEPAALAPAVRRIVAELDPGLAPYGVRTMADVRAESVARSRFFLLLLLTFAGIALALAVVGVYGVTAQAARQRTREIGVRMALGARPGDVLRLLARRGAVLIAAGLLAGVAAAVVAGRGMAALLYEVDPRDPLTLAAVVLILGGAGMAAALVPALRARSVDPTVALRAE